MNKARFGSFYQPRFLCPEIVKNLTIGSARAFVILHKYYCENVGKFVQNDERFSLDFSVALWYNIRGSREGQDQAEKIFQKLLKNPLTNTKKYGIIYV